MDKETIERLTTLLNAVSHVGYDFGFGEYSLCEAEIQEARDLFELLTSEDAQVS